MSLSRRCVETLLDLVDNKLTAMQVYDREDAREVTILETCKRELQALKVARPVTTGTVVPFAPKTANGTQSATH